MLEQARDPPLTRHRAHAGLEAHPAPFTGFTEVQAEGWSQFRKKLVLDLDWPTQKAAALFEVPMVQESPSMTERGRVNHRAPSERRLSARVSCSSLSFLAHWFLSRDSSSSP